MNGQSKTNYSLIVGMGATGLSIARFLQRKGLPFHFFDTRQDVPNLTNIQQEFSGSQIFLATIDEGVVSLADEIYLSPGVPRALPVIANAIAQGKSVVGDIELFLREVDKPIVGITGSNGKSTVTTLVGNAAQASGLNVGVGGNIGTPALELLNDDRDIYVLELSSFQLESTQTPNLTVACNLNVSADHMDRYDNFSAYVEAKQNIFVGAEYAVFNLEDSHTNPKPHVKHRYGFGVKDLSEAADDKEKHQAVDGRYHLSKQTGDLLFDGDILLNKSEMNIKGLHNIQNALAVFAIGEAAGFEREATKNAVRAFKGLPHRCEFVAEIDGVSYINDSKATNVGASVAAVAGLVSEFTGIILIAGGQGKGAEFTELGQCITDYIRVVILIGEDREDIASVLSKKTETHYADNLEAAVAIAKQQAEQGELVLLSPACASFDMFSGFEHRGQVFKDAVFRQASPKVNS